MRITSLALPGGGYCLLDLSAAKKMSGWFGMADGGRMETQTATFLLTLLLKAGLDHVSGLILEPQVGFQIVAVESLGKQGLPGQAFAVMEEKSPGTVSIFPNWGVEEVAANYGVGFLRLSYHPESSNALDQKKMVFEISDYCKMLDIDLILELNMIGQHGGKIHPDELAAAQLQAVSELAKAPQLFVLSYPGTPVAAAELASELDVPWVASSEQADFDDFKVEIRSALEAGAKGALANTSVWQDMGVIRNTDMSPDKEAIAKYIKTTVTDRLIELNRIVAEMGAK